MILINIETLSDSELRYIAEQENLDDWESLSREELIEELQDLYDEDDSTEKAERVSSEKYTKTLTSTPSDNVIQFPGVRMLPETYNETSIHQVLRDSNWSYVFWNVSDELRKELEEKPEYSLFLRNTVKQKDGTKTNYDIDISFEDTNWNIELPFKDCIYKIKLMQNRGNEAIKLCETPEFTISSSYYLNNPKQANNKEDNLINFKPLYNKNGKLLNNNDVKEILERAEEK